MKIILPTKSYLYFKKTIGLNYSTITKVSFNSPVSVSLNSSVCDFVLSDLCDFDVPGVPNILSLQFLAAVSVSGQRYMLPISS
jgi:hypothetical protein